MSCKAVIGMPVETSFRTQAIRDVACCPTCDLAGLGDMADEEHGDPHPLGHPQQGGGAFPDLAQRGAVGEVVAI